MKSCVYWVLERLQSREPFSPRGGDGICVSDLRGCVFGMLTIGTEAGEDDMDTTYATPIDWLLSDIGS